jgi:hypothetical protein
MSMAEVTALNVEIEAINVYPKPTLLIDIPVNDAVASVALMVAFPAKEPEEGLLSMVSATWPLAKLEKAARLPFTSSNSTTTEKISFGPAKVGGEMVKLS